MVYGKWLIHNGGIRLFEKWMWQKNYVGSVMFRFYWLTLQKLMEMKIKIKIA